MKYILFILPFMFYSAGMLAQVIQAGGPTTFCAGGNVVLTVSPATGITGYQWSNSGTIVGSDAAGYTANTSGSYSVKLSRAPLSDTIIGPVAVTVNPLPAVIINPATICTRQPTTLTASGADTYTWTPATGLSATTGPSVTANPSITTIYTVTGKNSFGCLNTATAAVNLIPNVDFSFPPNACSDINVVFTSNITSGTPGYKYVWDFGDGSTSNTPNPSHPLTSLGCGTANFDVNLTVTDSKGCSQSVTKSITIKQAPDVQISDLLSPGTPFSNCANDPSPSNPDYTIMVDNNSPGSSCITAYAIDWGDGTSTNNPAFPLNHTYTKLGAFNLKVTALGTNGCSHTKIYTVANQKNPDIGIGTFGLTEGCINLPVNIVLSLWTSNSPGTTYLLQYGDGNSTAFTHPINQANTNDTIVHTYTTTSCPDKPVYNITISATNACRTKSFSGGDIVAKIKPETDFTILYSPSCVGQMVCFNNTTKSGYDVNCNIYGAYLWDFGDPSSGTNNTSIQNSPCHTYANPGVYTVTLTTTNVCGPSAMTHTVCITTPPSPGFTLSDTTGCVPFLTTATDTTVAFNSCQNPKYSWVVSYTPSFCGTSSAFTYVNGTTDTSASPSFRFTNPGTYTISQNVTNACGIFTASKIITVNDKLVATITAPLNGCVAGPISPGPAFNCYSGPASYVWSFPGGSPNPPNDSLPGAITYNLAGNYTISLNITNVCGTTIVTRPIEINSVTTADAGPSQNRCGNSITMAANSPTFGTGQWTKLSGPDNFTINNSSSPATTITGLVAGTYIFRWTITNQACISSSDVTIIISSGASPAVAGPDQSLCMDTSTNLNAASPSIGTGTWIQVSGPATAIIATPLNNITTVNDLIPGVYVFRWTVSFSTCSPNIDDVQVTVYDNPSAANAGPDQTICAAGTSLAANTPTIGSGTWTQIGSLPGPATIANSALPSSSVSGLIPGIYKFKWTITSGPCPGTQDTVEINVTGVATIANAGSDQTWCALQTISLTGNVPQTGTGLWSLINGPNTPLITTPANNITTVTGLVTGVYSFRWTITNGVCPPDFDDVTIVILDSLQNTVAAPLSTICAGQLITISGANTSGGTGNYQYLWQQSINGTDWQDLLSESGQNYSAVLTSTLYFRRKLISLPCENFSNRVLIIVQPGISNNSISADQSLCINTPAATITGSIPSGGDGNYSYTWEQSINNGVKWDKIPGSNGIDFNPGSLTSTTQYRRLISTSLCNGTQSNISNIITITVNPDADAVFTSNPSIACSPFDLANAINLTPFPAGNGNYQWYANGILFGSNNTGIFPGYTILKPADTVMIKLKTTSPYGCRPDSTEQQFITVVAVQAKFTKDTGFGCGPLAVNFTNNSSILNGNIQYFWNFGNGSTSSLEQPGKVNFNSSPFFNDTTYRISLKAYNGCDTTIWQDSVKIRSNPKARFGVDTTFGCSPFTVQISNTSSGGPNTYYWDFGNGVKDTSLTNGLFNYRYNIGNAVDTFSIRLIAENECGRDSQSINLRVAPNIIRPLININSSQLFGCAPHRVSFNNSTSGATGYTWHFGDNTPPDITNNNQGTVEHTYDSAGVFTVSVDITNGCSDTTVYRQVTVYAKPLATFSTNASIYCAGDTVRVINNSKDATNYRWFWGDGTANTTPEPYHTFNIAGNYNIILRAERTNNAGLVCMDTLVRPVTVLAKPVVTIQSNLNTVNCAPFAFSVSAPGIIDEKLTWYFYDSTVTPSIITSNDISSQYTFNKPGSFYVKMVAANAQGCSDSTTIFFTVRGKAVASFTPFGLAVCTRDTTISYRNTSTYDGVDPLTYRWLVDDAWKSGDANFIHRYNLLPDAPLPGYFKTSLIVSNTVGCSDTASAILQMNPVAKAQFSITNSGDCVPFKPVIVNTSAYTTGYRWLLNGIIVSNEAIPAMVITSASTLYTITLIVDNTYDCKPDTLSITFTSRERPAASFTLSDTLGCSGVLNVATTNLTSGAGSYIWDWGDGTTNSFFDNPTHLYTKQGQYLITLVAGDGVCTDTTEQLVKVGIKPLVDFSVDQTQTCDTARVQFTNLTTDGAGFAWSFGDGTFSNATNPSKSFAPGLAPYTIKLVASGTLGCKDSAVKTNLVLAKMPPGSDFFISPSPVITIPDYTFSFNNLTLNSTNYKYLWSLGDGTFASSRDVTRKYADTGSYSIRLIVLDTITNCPDTTVKIARIDGFPGYLYIPNAICPACIQTNLREFLPKGAGLKEYRLQIYTTWNELIFETRLLDSKGAPAQAWDGKFKGTIVQQDVYVWRIDAKFLNGSEWLGMIYPGERNLKKVGTITVIK
ncbi:MAG: PKD domain-containing protein [Ferruginibacter sp.]